MTPCVTLTSPLPELLTEVCSGASGVASLPVLTEPSSSATRTQSRFRLTPYSGWLLWQPTREEKNSAQLLVA